MKNGRDGPNPVPGPLCNVWLDDDNEDSPVGGDPVAYVVAAGKCNHAGQGGWRGLTGNSTVFGIESRHSGSATEPWTPAVYDAYVRVVAAMCRHGIAVDNVSGHKEWSPGRKIDPTFDMAQFRRNVATQLRGITPAPVPPPPSVVPQPPMVSTLYDDQATSLASMLAASYDRAGSARGWPNIGLGSTGEWVRILQGSLRWVTGEPIVIDGQYGPITTNTVQRIQQLANLPVTGRTYETTWNAIRFFIGIKASTR
jgi:hypothetical protein